MSRCLENGGRRDTTELDYQNSRDEAAEKIVELVRSEDSGFDSDERYRLCFLLSSVYDFLPNPSNLASQTCVSCIENPAFLPCPLSQMFTIVQNLLIHR